MDEMFKGRKNAVAGLSFRFGIVWLATLAIFSTNFAQSSSGLPGAFLRLGVGTRALGLGGAFVALADDPSALYWNPAGLHHVRDLSLEFMTANLPFDQTLGFLSGAIPIDNALTIGIGWIGLQIDNLEARTSNTTEPDYIFQSRQNGFMVSFGKLVSSSLSVGGSLKLIRGNLAGVSASGMGFDVSVLTRPLARLQVGLVLQDISTEYRWRDNFAESVPLTVRIGTAFDLSEKIKLTVDYHKTSRVSPAVNVGAEFKPVDSFPVRLGLREGRLTGGVGVDLPLSSDKLAFDYAYGFDTVFSTAIHRVSLGFAFDSKSAKPRPHEPTPMPFSDATRSDLGAENEIEDSRSRAETTPLDFWIQVRAERLNVRSGPGLDYDRIGQIVQGEKYQVFERRNDWRRIELSDGQVGWIHRDYVYPVVALRLD